MKYRKIPVVIEAMRFDGTWTCAQKIINWMNIDNVAWVSSGKLEIPTLEGVMTAKAEDYVIKGVRGEFYPCDFEIFEETYEKAE